MPEQLNNNAVEIADMEFEGDTTTFSTAETDAASESPGVTEDYAATQSETYAETGVNPSPDALATEDYAATAPEADLDTYAQTEDVQLESETALAQDYAATETPPDATATMADEITLTPEAYASVEPGAQAKAALSAEGDIDQTAVEIAAADGRFSTLVELVGLAGLEQALNAEGPCTIFAPTNDAFAALPDSTLTHLKTEEGKAELTVILKSHVAEGAVLAGDVPLAGQEVQTLGDAALNVTGGVDGTLNVEGSATVGEGVYASNGVVYAIDWVILPEVEAPTVSDDTEG